MTYDANFFCAVWFFTPCFRNFPCRRRTWLGYGLEFFIFFDSYLFLLSSFWNQKEIVLLPFDFLEYRSNNINDIQN